MVEGPEGEGEVALGYQYSMELGELQNMTLLRPFTRHSQVNI